MEIEQIKEHINEVLIETNFQQLGEKTAGRVRDIYTAADHITLISTDRHSSFDRNIAYIPFKGELMTQTSLFWFDNTKDIIQNHVISTPDSNVKVVKKCRPLQIECVVRGYITGVTSTSLWTHYGEGKRDFGNFVLGEGLIKNQKLLEPVFNPTTKSYEHDKPITPGEIVEQKFLSKEIVDEVEKISLALYKRGHEVSLEKGLILVDTKYEFGFDENNKLTLIDELHSPDTSRYWKADTYEERFKKGEEPESLDKEFFRLWFKENCNPYKDATLPEAPVELIVELSRRYIEIYEKLTGLTFKHDFTLPIIERITKNLAKAKLQKA